MLIFRCVRVLKLPAFIVISAVLTGCLTQDQRTFQKQQRYVQAHPGMEQCYMEATPEHPEHGAAAVYYFEKTQLDEGISCLKKLKSELSPAEKRALTQCVLASESEDRRLGAALLMEQAAHPPTRIVVPPAQVLVQPSPPPRPAHTTCMPIGFGVSCDSY
jgi:hypothetical protein